MPATFHLTELGHTLQTESAHPTSDPRIGFYSKPPGRCGSVALPWPAASCIWTKDPKSDCRLSKRLAGSIGRVAPAGDSAAMESFFALLQANVVNRCCWRTRAELHCEIVSWIEHTYNQRRRQSALGRLTPIEYEMINTPQAATAA